MAVDNVNVLSKANFEKDVLQSGVPVLVDFWASWCGPCRMVAPIISQLAGEYQDKVVFGKVNVDEERELASKYGIMSIPTLVLFKGGKQVDQIIGARPKNDIEKMIKKHLP